MSKDFKFEIKSIVNFESALKILEADTLLIPISSKNY